MAKGVRSYRDLVVWQKAIGLAAACYRKSKPFPASELYGMTAQIRRSAASIPANIAEGNGREGTGAYFNFFHNAKGSLEELETHTLLSETVGLMPPQDSQEVLAECETVGKMHRALIRSLQDKEGR